MKKLPFASPAPSKENYWASREPKVLPWACPILAGQCEDAQSTAVSVVSHRPDGTGSSLYPRCGRTRKPSSRKEAFPRHLEHTVQYPLVDSRRFNVQERRRDVQLRDEPGLIGMDRRRFAVCAYVAIHFANSSRSPFASTTYGLSTSTNFNLGSRVGGLVNRVACRFARLAGGSSCSRRA